MLRVVHNPPIIRVRLKYPDVETFTQRYAHRLTSKGLFLVVKTPSLPGAQVRFELLLETSQIVFSGIGEITWIKPFPDSKGFYGMIIRFISLDNSCDEILQQALSFKDAARKDAFDHQKIAEDPLPDDQVDTTPYISPRRFSGSRPPTEDPATNRYYAVPEEDPPQEESPTDSGSLNDMDSTLMLPPGTKERREKAKTLLDDSLEEEREKAPTLLLLAESKDKEKPKPAPPEDDFDDEAPTEDTAERRAKRAGGLIVSSRFLLSRPPTNAGVSESAPTNKTPSLSAIGFELPKKEDNSDVTTGENLTPQMLKAIAPRMVFGDDDVPTDSSTKQFVVPVLPPREKIEPSEAPPVEEDLLQTEASPKELSKDVAFEDTQEPEPIVAKPALLTPRPSALAKSSILREEKPEPITLSKRPITQNDPPTNIRIMLAKPIPTQAADQDAEMERLAQEAGLADLDELVRWSRELIKNFPRTPAQIEQELMALAIASKKFF